MAAPRLVVNRLLDTVARPRVRVFGREQSAFLACGKVALAASIGLGVVLTLAEGLSVGVILVLSCTSVAALLAQAMAMKAFTLDETLVYYRHEIAIVAVAALTLFLLGEPIWPYLDITILAVGLFLAVGRIGCLMVGCCHGRPSGWGVTYTGEHAAAGFTSHYVGVRLFPIQIVESLWVLIAVGVGAAIVLRGSTPGAAAAWYVIFYDLGRFCFEFFRGDPDRPYFAEFSEGQWTSAALMVLVVIAEAYGVLPFRWWHAAATGAIVAWMAVTLLRRTDGLTRARVLRPSHVREVARALEAATPTSPDPATHRTVVHVAHTSLGVQISGGRAEGAMPLRHYTISSTSGTLTPEAAEAVADSILDLLHVHTAARLMPASSGVFHLLIPTSGSA